MAFITSPSVYLECHKNLLWPNRYRAWSDAIAFDRDAPDVVRQRVVAHSFRPLDYQHGSFIAQQVVKIYRVGGAGAFVEAIKIDVIKLQSSGVRVYEREGRTCYVFLCDTDCSADSFYKNRFASAEWTTQQKNLAAFKTSTDLVPVIECLLRR